MEAAASKPLMGICVGMQMLLDHSDEQDTPGLGLIPGVVRRFELTGRRQPDGSRFKVPQMGWNQVHQQAHEGALHPIWAGVPDASYFYFVHSYHASPSDPRHTAALTDYGDRFTCAVARDNIFATQFKALHAAGDQAQAGCVLLVAVVQQHLHAHAHTHQGLVGGSMQHGVAQA